MSEAKELVRRGEAIDRFTVLEPLGAGGMGIVVSAYDCTLDRKVAIKLLRPERFAVRPEEGRALLLREAQAMARLSHPNVITVYEVGTTGDQVFVAMELVDGETLADWLRRGPPWRDVVQKFVRAGRGLAAAHRAGLVHRDFKPDNVLVGRGGEVRVTDFGLASASPGSLAAEAVPALSMSLTESGVVRGTPAYMSPEQHAGDKADAHSDQFSFCVALYEAFYGVRPFAGNTQAEIFAAIAARRFAPPRREAPRWLRAVVMRGLEMRPEDRWPGMEPLLAELARDPAAARRRWFAGGAAVLVAGLAGWLTLRDRPSLCESAAAPAAALWDAAQRQRVRAAFVATRSPVAADTFDRVDRMLAGQVAAWAAARTDACEATHVRGEQSEAMLDLRMRCLERARRQIASLVDVWSGEGVDLDKAVGAAGSAADLASCADTDALAAPVPLPRDPVTAQRVERVRAQVDTVEAHLRAGRLATGLDLARKAVADARATGHGPVIAEALYRNGKLECEVGKLDAGVPLLYEAARSGAAAHDDVLVARVFRELLFYVGVRDKKLQEAATIWKFAEVALDRAGGRDQLQADLLYAQGAILHEQDKFEESMALLQRALSIYQRVRPADHPDLARTVNLMAYDEEGLGRFEQAEANYRRALAMWERSVGPDHSNVAITLNNLANTLVSRGDYDGASTVAERALAIVEKVFPPDHPSVATALHTLAVVRGYQGRSDEEVSLFQRADRIRVAALGPNHPQTMVTREALAAASTARGDTATARRLYDEVIPALIAAYGDDHTRVANAYNGLGQTLLREKDASGADAAFSRALAIWRKHEGVPEGMSTSLGGLGDVRTLQGRFDAAIALYEQARALDEKMVGPDHPWLAGAYLDLGMAHFGAGHIKLAVDNLERGVAIGEKSSGEGADLAMARFELARALWASGARKRAVALATAARDYLAEKKIAGQLDEVARWLHGKRAARGE